VAGQAAIIGVGNLYFFQEKADIPPIRFLLDGCDSAEDVSVQQKDLFLRNRWKERCTLKLHSNEVAMQWQEEILSSSKTY
jgi:hypothetical protein